MVLGSAGRDVAEFLHKNYPDEALGILTYQADGGANLRAIQEMMGHESIGTTQIYTHIDMHTLREEILEHHPRNMMDK